MSIPELFTEQAFMSALKQITSGTPLGAIPAFPNDASKFLNGLGLFSTAPTGPAGPAGPAGSTNFFQSPRVQLSAAQLLLLDTVPVTLVAAPGAGMMIFNVGWCAVYKFVTTPYTFAGGTLLLNVAGGIAIPATGLLDNGASEGHYFAGCEDNSALSTMVNKPIQISATNSLLGGDGTLELTAIYCIIDVS